MLVIADVLRKLYWVRLLSSFLLKVINSFLTMLDKSRSIFNFF